VGTSSDRAYETLRAWILEGRYEMGVRLGEVELASSLGISRTPVREALRKLGADGLVDLESNRGARVAAWTEDDIDEIFILRTMLESHGAALAAPRVDEETLGHLEDVSDRMESIVEARADGWVAELTEANTEFHSTVLVASGSTRLPGLVSSVVQMPLALRTFSRYSDVALRRSMEHHRELIAALGAHDALWAKSVMRAHIQAARFEVSRWNALNAAAQEGSTSVEATDDVDATSDGAN
jgi:DNA-binding GntR family transcriptional regulator